MTVQHEKDNLPPLAAHISPKHYYVSNLRKVEPKMAMERWLNENAHGGWDLRFMNVIGFVQFNNITDYTFFRMTWDDQ